ncbi:MAG: hypothetical protein M9887_10425 [Chitinophagales bacterium]|nr:hypothetical protein [Chitinophagales bacterium]
MKTNQKFANSEILFFCITLFYGILILTNTQYYSPHDDFLFLNAFDEGKWRGIQSSEFSTGRYNLMHGFDLFLMTFFNKTGSSTYYYFISFCLFICNSYIFYYIVRPLLHNSRFLLTGLYTLLLFSTSFTSIYFRLLYPERYIIFFLGLIFILHLKLLQGKNQKLYLILILLCSNYMMNLKEPTILCVIFLGIGNLFMYSSSIEKQSDKKFLYNGIGLILSGILALTIYYLIILPQAQSHYGANGIPFFINFLKSIVEWTLADPIIFILFLPFFTYHFIQSAIRKKIDIYDVFGWSAVGYILTFFIKGIAYSSHYLTPAYILIIPFLIKNFHSKNTLKYLLYLSVILQMGNVSLGINDILFQKYNNKNFHQIINTMSDITQRHYKKYHTKTIFHVLGGKDQGNHFSSGALYFMNKKGNDEKMFDFSSFEPIWDSAYSIMNIKNPPYTFMNSNLSLPISKGDYILYTPYTVLKPEEDKHPKTLIQTWQAPSYFGYLNFKDALRTCIVSLYKNKALIRDNKSYKIAQYKLYKVL